MSYILYNDGKNPSIGKKVGSKKDKVSIKIKNNKIKHISGNRIVVEFTHQSDGYDEVISVLNNKASNAEISDLYELLDEDEEYNLNTLSELLYEDKENFSVAAAYIALKNDNFYFREKNKKFVLNDRNHIQEKLKQDELKKIREQEKREIQYASLHWLEVNYPDYPEDVPDYIIKFLKPVRQYAVFDQEYKNFKLAKRNLKLIKDTIPKLQISDDAYSAFRVCNKFGIFEDHENLAIERYNIITDFNEEELSYTKEIISKKFEEESREDYTEHNTFTIDDETTLDYDDAFSIIKEEDTYKVMVHIADVACYIEKDSILDKHASNLGMSVYLPSKKISMFPAQLSEQVISLNSGKNKPAMTFVFRFDADYNLIDKEIKKSIINVNNNYSYTQADEMIKNNENKDLILLKEIAEKLRKVRFQKDAIEFMNPFFKISINDSIEITKSNPFSESFMLVKEYMVLTGYYAASYCLVNNIPCVYITQDEPTEVVSIGDNRILYDIVSILNTLRKLNKTSLMTIPSKHYSLGLECYTQCTSPIRRYHDLIIQRQISAHLNNKDIPYTKENIQRVSATSEQYRLNISKAEREEKNYWILKHLKENKNEFFEGTIISGDTSEYRIYLDNYGLQGKLFSNRRLRIGHKIKVKPKKITPRTSLLYLTLGYNKVK